MPDEPRLWIDRANFEGDAEPVADTVGTDDPHELLEDTVRAWVSKGWRIESQLPDQVVLVHGHRVNHVLHFLIGFITFGLWWLFVWLPLGLFGGEKRRVIGIDPVSHRITKRRV